MLEKEDYAKQLEAAIVREQTKNLRWAEEELVRQAAYIHKLKKLLDIKGA